MTDDGNGERNCDCVEATEISIRNISTEQRNQVDPELVKGANAGRSPLALSKRS